MWLSKDLSENSQINPQTFENFMSIPSVILFVHYYPRGTEISLQLPLPLTKNSFCICGTNLRLNSD